MFLTYPAAERRHEGLLRIAVPASCAKLRWSDYLQRNKVERRRRTYFSTRGNPAFWLATDASVPFGAFRSMDVWYRGAWVAVGDVTDEDFAAYLTEPLS